MKKSLLVILVLVASLFGDISYEKAYALYDQGDFNSSIKMFKNLVNDEQDDDAAYILGYMYEYGEGCEANTTKSQEYYKIAAHGYYWNHKENPLHNSKKAQKRIYETLDKSDDEITEDTIKQYTQSLYNIKAYKANFFLPVSYRLGKNYTVSPDSNHTSKQLESEFQVSLKYDFAPNLFGFDEIYSIAYTQISFWQLYVTSAYFRESNYNPEFFVLFPVPTIPYLRAVRLDLAHQSNGRGGDNERSWNYVSAEFNIQTGFFFSRLKIWKDVFSLKYNTDLMDYLGYGEIQFILPYKRNLLTITARNPLSKYRATTLDYTYPFFGSNDLFLYVKVFTGYGETLIDYNHRVNKIAIGFSISR